MIGQLSSSASCFSSNKPQEALAVRCLEDFPFLTLIAIKRVQIVNTHRSTMYTQKFNSATERSGVRNFRDSGDLWNSFAGPKIDWNSATFTFSRSARSRSKQKDAFTLKPQRKAMITFRRERSRLLYNANCLQSNCTTFGTLQLVTPLA